MSNILPPLDDERLVPNSVSLPPTLWERLQAIADETKREDARGKGYSRNMVIRHFLEWAATEYEKERATKKKK